MPTVCVTGMWAGMDSVWEQENADARKMLENAAESHTSGAPWHDRSVMFHGGTEASSENAVLDAFCLSQFTHKRTLPKNANQMKNTTKPNSFLASETIRGYTFDTNIHTPPSACLTLNRSGKDNSNFSLATNAFYFSASSLSFRKPFGHISLNIWTCSSSTSTSTSTSVAPSLSLNV